MEKQVSFRLPGLGNDDEAPAQSFRLGTPESATESPMRFAALDPTPEDVDSLPAGSDASLNSDDEGPRESKLEDTLANMETRIVRFLRTMIWLGLFLTAIIVCAVVFWWLKSTETKNFEDHFEELCEQFVAEVHSNLQLHLQVLHLVSLAFTATAVESQQTWPFVTFQDYDVVGSAARAMLASPSLCVYPLVTRELRTPWEEYTQQPDHLQWTRQQSTRKLQVLINIFEQENSKNVTWNGLYGTNPRIFRQGNPQLDQDPFVPEPDDAEGPFYPSWQVSPYTDSVLKEINYNFYDPALPLQQPLAIVQTQQQALLATASKNNTPDQNPVAPLLYPIFDNSSTSSTVVAILELDFLFAASFSYILPPDSNAILVVLSNPCQPETKMSYQITGDQTEFLGYTDHHDPDFNHLQVTTLFTDFIRHTPTPPAVTYTGVPLHTDYCPWQFTIYATQDMQDHFLTNRPVGFTILVLLVFLWTCAIFLLYDRVIERRQRKVMQTAIKSDQIVSQLFPTNFRDALYENDAQKKKTNDDTGANTSPKSRTTTSGVAFHADIVEEFRRSVGANHTEQNQPMARLYPNCTVFFADIAGFTAWSSARSPVQVFTLLEALYGAFDKIAHRRKVFKIETIGDCYVAVTGLPQPQPTHAIFMVKFARDILAKVPKVLKRLAPTLGPDTIGLAMRVGLHSGPVTAGVLRGEKARFQLFGDTVNTAARMESNGKKEAIHASQEVADILYASGKGHWVHPRGEKIFAKGKGELQTYWILPTTGESAMFGESMLLDIGSDEDDEDEMADPIEKEHATFEAALVGLYKMDDGKERKRKMKWAEKNYKTVGWVVELLFWEVKSIAWERRSGAEIDVDDIWEQNGTKGMEVKWDDDLTKALFDLHNSTNQRGDKLWRVAGDNIKDQLNLFVLRLAFQYSDDAPFHNFDHTVQVLMACDKLLKQLSTTLGNDQQPNAWVKFTALLAVLIGDIRPAHFGLDRVSDLPKAAEQHKLAFQNAIDRAWDLLLDKRLSDLRCCVCSNDFEYDYFRQLLVNLVYAGDISLTKNYRDREERWVAAFEDPEQEPSLPKRIACVLERLSLACQWTHTMQIWETYKKWNANLYQELADDYEKKLIPADPAINWFHQEIKLFDKIIIPSLEKLLESNALEATGTELLKHATHNRRAWGRLFLSRT